MFINSCFGEKYKSNIYISNTLVFQEIPKWPSPVLSALEYWQYLTSLSLWGILRRKIGVVFPFPERLYCFRNILDWSTKKIYYRIINMKDRSKQCFHLQNKMEKPGNNILWENMRNYSHRESPKGEFLSLYKVNYFWHMIHLREHNNMYKEREN